MKRKITSIAFCLILILSSLVILNLKFGIVEVVEGETLYVNSTGDGGAFTSIQDAINASSDGDTVFVYSGTYYEVLLINKPINLKGEGRDTTIIDSQGNGNVVEITSNWVNMTGFTVRQSIVHAGVKFDSVHNCNISYVNSTENNYGIFMYNSDINSISNNHITFNNEYGIFLSLSDSNTIIDNNVTKNYFYGIHLSQSNDNDVENNDFSLNDGYGAYLRYSTWNEIAWNKFSNNRRGIEISNSHNNNITGNTAINNTYGIDLYNSYENIINENLASLNKYGIYLSHSFDEIITGNMLINNDYGIHLYSSTNIHIDSNTMIGDGIYIKGDNEEVMNSHYIDTSNTVNGKPVYYWKFVKDAQIPSDAGQVILVNCERIKVKNLKLTHTCAGIQLYYSAENLILENNITNNQYGFEIFRSDYNNISRNNITNNFEGCHLRASQFNIIMGNSIIDNNAGIPASSAKNNEIFQNNLSFNNFGIFFFACSWNNISENYLSNNDYGFYLHEARDNYIFHNKIINNTDQVSKDYDSEFWDKDYPIGGNFWSDYLGKDLYKGPNQDQPGSDGIGDTPYVINSYNQDNYPLMEPYTYKPLENYTVLKQGWNLISIPLVQENQSLKKVLEMIDGWYDAVQWYDVYDSNDPWKHYKVGKPYGNDLSQINETMSFWIHITNRGDTIFLYNGTQPTENKTILLHEGWNLVGYPSLTNYNRTVGLNKLAFDTHVDAIWTYDAGSQTYKELSETDYFIIGKGYWMHSKVEIAWKVPV